MTSLEEVYEPIASKAKHLRDSASELIPHQLHMTVENIHKMSKGKSFKIPHHHLGSHRGGSVLMLHPHNAHKIREAYEKGKDAMMKLSPHETHASFGHGLLGSLYEGAKSVGSVLSKALDNPQFNEYAQKAVEGAATAAGTALGTFVGNPVMGAAAGNALGKLGASAIKNHKVVEGAIGSLMSNPKAYAAEQIGEEIKKKVPKKYQRVAEQAVYDYMPSGVRAVEQAQSGIRRGRQFYPDLEEDYGDVVRRSDYAGHNTGYEAVKRRAREAYDNYGFPQDVHITHAGRGRKKGKGMNKQPSAVGSGIRKRRRGGNVGDDIKNAFTNFGNQVKDTFQPVVDVGNQIVSGATDVGNQIVSGARDVGNQIVSGANEFIHSFDDITHDPQRRDEAEQLGKQLASLLIHQGIPVAASTLGGALADALAAGTLQPELIPVASFLGAEAGNQGGQYLADLIGEKTGLGIKRPRGRPRKVGKGAALSKPFKMAMTNNFGFEPNHFAIHNAPVSQFRTNPHVTPAPAEMTLSPYQRINSPAMNPFIPTTYIQQGGTSCGYGGRGMMTAHRSGAGMYRGSEKREGHGLF
jgi:hypothetical protein